MVLISRVARRVAKFDKPICDLRSLCAQDEKELHYFLTELFQEQGESRTLVGNFKNYMGDLPGFLEAQSASQGNAILGAFLNGRLAVVADFYDETLKGDPHPVEEIGISVLKHYRSLGVASALLNIAISAASKTCALARAIPHASRILIST